MSRIWAPIASARPDEPLAIWSDEPVFVGMKVTLWQEAGFDDLETEVVLTWEAGEYLGLVKPEDVRRVPAIDPTAANVRVVDLTERYIADEAMFLHLLSDASVTPAWIASSDDLLTYLDSVPAGADMTVVKATSAGYFLAPGWRGSGRVEAAFREHPCFRLVVE